MTNEEFIRKILEIHKEYYKISKIYNTAISTISGLRPEIEIFFDRETDYGIKQIHFKWQIFVNINIIEKILKEVFIVENGGDMS